MKKQIILGSFLALAGLAYSQNTFPTGVGTSVGIGTMTPSEPLEIVTEQNDAGIKIIQKGNTTYTASAALTLQNRSTGGRSWSLNSLGIANIHGRGNFVIYDATSGIHRFFISGGYNSSYAAGNIGIGTTEPIYKLDVQSGVANDGINVTQTLGHAAALHLTNGSSGGKHWAIFSTGNGNAQGSGHFSIYDYSVFADRFFISGGSTSPLIAAGNIGIGTNSPKSKLSVNGNVHIGVNTAQGVHADYKLSVEGKIVAQSLYITAANGTNWADYVFADDYKLPTLYEIEKYYKANKHLPEIPTTEEIAEKGINVSEMNVLLLKKIEEMTILMVKQQKQIDALNEKVK